MRKDRATNQPTNQPTNQHTLSMCGIFGSLSLQSIDWTQFQALAQANTQRGNLGYGISTRQGQTLQTQRATTPLHAADLSVQNTTSALGHVLAPTQRRHAAVSHVHPFETADFLLAHNGLLLNHTDFAAWQYDASIAVDTQVIVGGVQQQLDQGLPVSEAIATVAKQLEGQQACWLWHKSTAQLYLWRVMAPIWIARTESTFTFSSLRFDAPLDLLPEGTVWQLDPNTLAFKQVATFAYESQYHTRPNNK